MQKHGVSRRRRQVADRIVRESEMIAREDKQVAKRARKSSEMRMWGHERAVAVVGGLWKALAAVEGEDGAGEEEEGDEWRKRSGPAAQWEDGETGFAGRPRLRAGGSLKAMPMIGRARALVPKGWFRVRGGQLGVVGVDCVTFSRGWCVMLHE